MSLGGVLGGVFKRAAGAGAVRFAGGVSLRAGRGVRITARSRPQLRFAARFPSLPPVPARGRRNHWFAFRLPKPLTSGSRRTADLPVGDGDRRAVLLERPFRLALGAGAMYAATQLAGNANSNVLMQDRSFFGTYRVRRVAGSTCCRIGTTTHGGQSRELERRMDPLTYYYKAAHSVTSSPRPCRAGAARGDGGTRNGDDCRYGRPEEHWTFYEIDPMVVQIARAPMYSHTYGTARRERTWSSATRGFPWRRRRMASSTDRAGRVFVRCHSGPPDHPGGAGSVLPQAEGRRCHCVPYQQPVSRPSYGHHRRWRTMPGVWCTGRAIAGYRGSREVVLWQSMDGAGQGPRDVVGTRENRRLVSTRHVAGVATVDG